MIPPPSSLLSPPSSLLSPPLLSSLPCSADSERTVAHSARLCGSVAAASGLLSHLISADRPRCRPVPAASPSPNHPSHSHTHSHTHTQRGRREMRSRFTFLCSKGSLTSFLLFFFSVPPAGLCLRTAGLRLREYGSLAVVICACVFFLPPLVIVPQL